MTQDWSTLIAAGLPDGALRPAATCVLSVQGVRHAIERLAAAPPTHAQQRELLAAWLGAFSHHWPAEFAATAGDDGVRLLEAVRTPSLDLNRYLKLRRIALANLSAARRLP